MMILGVDPGTRSTGYGIVRSEPGGAVCVEYGAIHCPARLPAWECHVRIADGIAKLVGEYALDAVAVESQFFCKNVRTALRIGEARSVALLPVTRAGLPIHEYAPARVKQAVVGNGNARKEQVQTMVRSLLKIREEITPLDAADALAIALCHVQTQVLKERIA
jgi:crossover junction endodeoxyribonuclease RuvC